MNDTFFSALGQIITFLNDFKIIGDVSVFHILLMVIVVGIIGLILKGKS